MRSCLLLFSLLMCCGCATSKDQYAPSQKQLEALAYILERGEGSIYKKTITSSPSESISYYLENEEREFYFCQEEIAFGTYSLTREEVRELNVKFDQQTPVNLKRLLPGKKSQVATKHVRFETSSISLPVLFRNDSLALYYVEQTYGAQFNLLRYSDGAWEYACSGSAWIE